MNIALDHVFVCCAHGAPETQALLDIGLVEGTSNVHPGQGTTNRRFFFDGGFLELLWVSNLDEAQSSLTMPTKLWQRWSTRNQGSCPFGIAFRPIGDDIAMPPFLAWDYRPQYLPPDKHILFAEQTSLQEPELFYLNWIDPQKSSLAQPKDHPNGLQRLISASVGLPAETSLSAASIQVQAAGLLCYHVASRYELQLSFNGREPVSFDLAPALPIVLTGVSEEV